MENPSAKIAKKQMRHGSIYVEYTGTHPVFGEVKKTVAYHGTADFETPDNDEWGPLLTSVRTGFSVKVEIPQEIEIPESAKELIQGYWEPLKSNLPHYRQNPLSLREEAISFFKK